MIKTTEQSSLHHDLEKKSVLEVLQIINSEDQKVALAVNKVLPQIEPLISKIIEKMKQGGRLFYIGAGTSGRLGILDASECPPTYGVPRDYVIGIIAGGEKAIQSSVESAEDDVMQAWNDLSEYQISDKDVVVGIAASGTTPYVVHGLKMCRENNIATGSISCNIGAPISENADFPIEVVVGPEVVTGSTRMKSGTAQKLILNMISTTVMIGLGRVVDNRMVDMQLSNDKLVDRGAKMIQQSLNIDYKEALRLLELHGSVRKSIESYQ
ncbi:N-acetylmuramic acid 6-phosphate etherase [Membranihabitans marinus]|uniref:N-acetylmuramic acid 6-phosphate etherase n=1 Tax=Membranihabitans marinus TaxID=1227546 RepID=UPI001F011E9E|nr:N-acetylmuramic acid 6-phosphate etherase [Membranihabitans marinus]